MTTEEKEKESDCLSEIVKEYFEPFKESNSINKQRLLKN